MFFFGRASEASEGLTIDAKRQNVGSRAISKTAHLISMQFFAVDSAQKVTPAKNNRFP